MHRSVLIHCGKAFACFAVVFVCVVFNFLFPSLLGLAQHIHTPTKIFTSFLLHIGIHPSKLQNYFPFLDATTNGIKTTPLSPVGRRFATLYYCIVYCIVYLPIHPHFACAPSQKTIFARGFTPFAPCNLARSIYPLYIEEVNLKMVSGAGSSFPESHRLRFPLSD